MKFVLKRQYDSMQCGVACLWMICNSFGLTVSFDRLERLSGAGRDGVSVRGISTAAESVGLRVFKGWIGLSGLNEIKMPCILHWEGNHFVVLYKVNKSQSRFWIADPAKGKYVLSRKEFGSKWLSRVANEGCVGVCVWFEKSDNTECCESQEDKIGTKYSLLRRHISGHKKTLALIAVTLGAGSVCQLILPVLTQKVVDAGIAFQRINIIWLILIGELAIVAGKTLMEFFRGWLLLKVSTRINISMLSEFFCKLLHLPMPFFDSRQTGDLMQRMLDYQRIQKVVTGQSVGALFSLLSFVIFGILLGTYDSSVFCVYIWGGVCYVLWMLFFLKKRKIIDYELFKVQAENQNKTFRFLTSVPEIKLQGCSERRRTEWEDIQTEMYRIQIREMRLKQCQEAGAILINEVKNLIITGISAIFVIEGRLSLGQMLAIQYVVGQLNAPMEYMMRFVYALQDVHISLERVNEIHAMQMEDEMSANRKDADLSTGIKVSHLSFRYDKYNVENILDDVSLDIPAGKVTAIVGSSGSGKSTLIKLLLGFYRPTKGNIMIGDVDLEYINKEWWRSKCGVVMQEGVVFSESVARNIAVADGKMDKTLVVEAAVRTNLKDFIYNLPNGFDTIIGFEGHSLSLGQRQRILIARALYKNAPFMFLDEATNSLDALNEAEISENLALFYRGRTVVIVAHRLSTVRKADNIIVLEKGRIVESGTHEQLTARRGHYYNLVRNQLELGC